MKKLVAGFLLLLGLPSLTPTQSHSRTSHTRVVSLETILSCPDDSLLEEVFKTDSFTAHFKLGALMMISSKRDRAGNPEYLALRTKRFVTDTVDESRVTIMPTDDIGNLIERSKLPFCHYAPLALYDSDAGLIDKEAKPRLVEINGEDWFFDSREVFAHADQFQFQSGVLANSTIVYITATKDRTTIQFVYKPEGLKFNRAFYTRGK